MVGCLVGGGRLRLSGVKGTKRALERVRANDQCSALIHMKYELGNCFQGEKQK